MELLQGTLDGLILKALSWGPLHGYAVTRWIKSGFRRRVPDRRGGPLPCPSPPGAEGLGGAEWGLSENNRRAKFYQLTGKGRRALEDERTSWTRYADGGGPGL